MDDPYPLRTVTEDEFEIWTRMVADTYGSDLSDEQVAHERAATELPRTIAAFDGPVPVTPTHRRRGILTSLMRRQLTDLHTSGAEPIAALRPSEAAIYGRYGYGPATQGARLRCDERAVRFRPGTDFGDGTIRLQERGGASALRFALHHDADGRTTGHAL
ncbi:GNAT family N-acetyltransferase [Streptomyces prunicolor]|uniref:GNAT family N-acetyltransferase n=1 Tax=Streptomyces prunicolor TaxID=67348 RepID=UPI00371A5060